MTGSIEKIFRNSGFLPIFHGIMWMVWPGNIAGRRGLVMEAIIMLLQKVLPVFLVLGVLCRKKALLTREGINALKRVAVDIALPAVMFNAFATAEYSLKSVCVPLTMFAVCCGALFLGLCAV